MPTDGDVVVRRLEPEDVASFRDGAKFRSYLADQGAGLRSVYVADCAGAIAGHVSLLWTAADPVLLDLGVPEISDLSVDEEFRGRGIGTALLERAEAEAATRSARVGLNVGLHSGYGAAQRLYARRGYLPDGSGVQVEGATVPEGAAIRLDDDPVVTLRMTKELDRPTESSSLDRHLEEARRALRRLDPSEAHDATRRGALLVDIRPEFQRRRDGEIPGAIIVERNHLEWRLHPDSPARIPEATGTDVEWIVLCDEGYASSLAAAVLRTLGLRGATDVVGGLRAWRAAGMPIGAPGQASPPRLAPEGE